MADEEAVLGTGPVAKLLRIGEEAKKKVFERDEVIQAIILGLLTKNHVFIYGPPGTAKSQAARLIGNALTDCKFFYKQLTRQMTEEAVFGPLDIPEWRTKGTYRYNTKGGAAEAEICVMEEYFDASDALIRAMNELLNEREFSRSLGTVKKCPLHTCIATSNFWRNEGDAQAVADRFLIRTEVSALAEAASRRAMIKGYLEDQKPSVARVLPFSSISEIYEDEVSVLPVGDDVIEAYDDVCDRYRQSLPKSIYVSDRRVAWASMLIRAGAVINKREEADLSDIKTAEFGLCFMGRDVETTAFKTAYDKVLGAHEKRMQGKQEIKTFRRAFEKVRERLAKGGADVVAELHQQLMTIKEGIGTRPASGIPAIDKDYEELTKDVKILIEEIQKKVDPSKMKAMVINS